VLSSTPHHATLILISLSFFLYRLPRPPISPLFPYTTALPICLVDRQPRPRRRAHWRSAGRLARRAIRALDRGTARHIPRAPQGRSEEHTSELQSQSNLVCRLLLEKKKK